METLDKEGDELREAATLIKADFLELEVSQCEEVLKNVLAQFTLRKRYSYALWEHLTDFISIRREFAWELFNIILKDKEVIVFFEYSDDVRMFAFEDGGQLPQVLENCYKFDFYVTDRKQSFLLSYNDHEYLIACGMAKEWIGGFENL